MDFMTAVIWVLSILTVVATACYLISFRNTGKSDGKDTGIIRGLRGRKSRDISGLGNYRDSRRLFLYLRSEKRWNREDKWLAYYEMPHCSGDSYESALNRLVRKNSDSLGKQLSACEHALVIAEKHGESERVMVLPVEMDTVFMLDSELAKRYGVLYGFYNRMPFDQVEIGRDGETATATMRVSQRRYDDCENGVGAMERDGQSVYGALKHTVQPQKPVVLIDREVDSVANRSKEGNADISFIAFMLYERQANQQ